MVKWRRRQVLLAGFIAGAGLSVTTSHFRRQDDEGENAKGADLAYEAEVSASEIRQLEERVSLRQPTIPYNRQMSKLLVRCCRLATEQYLQGVADPDYDGAIASLNSYFPQLDNYEQIAAFRAIRKRSWLEPLISKTALRDLIFETDLIYHGFALKSDAHNIVVFRGTQEPAEWVGNLKTKQVHYRSNNDRGGKIHQGFHSLYLRNLALPIRTALEQMESYIPCYLTGHSLGGAMAILSAVDIALNFTSFKEQIRMYAYAPPRVGDPTFAEFYSNLIPNSYRIVSEADSTWLLPPILFQESVYLHVGQQWSFINQTGDLSLNHQLNAYQAAIDRERETYPAPF
ncbi:lipase family protein [Myxosarcina sp. GI1(2024)]